MLALLVAMMPAVATMVIASEVKSENRLFNVLDVDRNGSISAEEAASNELIAKGWKNFDANSNGVLEMAEFDSVEKILKSAEAAGGMSGGVK